MTSMTRTMTSHRRRHSALQSTTVSRCSRHRSVGARRNNKRMRRLLFLLLASLLISILSPTSLFAGAVLTQSEAIRELRLPKKQFYTPKELKAAYRKRSLETHPDKGGTEAELVRVAEAYQELLLRAEGGGGGGGGSGSAGRGSGSGSGSGSSGTHRRRDYRDGSTSSQWAHEWKNQWDQWTEGERMRQAEDLFFEMFDDLFDEDAVGKAIDDAFDRFAQHRSGSGSRSSSNTDSAAPARLGWGMTMLKRAVKWGVPRAVRLLERDDVSISFNGKTMTGRELREWRERKRRQRQAEKREGVADEGEAGKAGAEGDL